MLATATTLAAISVPAAAAPAAATTDRVSVSSSGIEGSAASGTGISVSSSGRFVAFTSAAPNLVPGDTNGDTDVFVRDVVGGTTIRASVGADGREANAQSFYPSITADGRLVAFESLAWNLVPEDVNGASDIFVRDLVAGTTTLVSTNELGVQGDKESNTPAVSADGGFVAFDSSATNLVAGDGNGAGDIFVKNLTDGSVQLASLAWDEEQSNNSSRAASVSNDGNRVAFMSAASNLTSRFDSNGADDVFVRDLAAGTTALVSADPDGNYVEAESMLPSISADGRFVAFESNGPILPPVIGNHVYVRNLDAATTLIADIQLNGQPATAYTAHGSISSTGRFVAFVSTSRKLVLGDTNGAMDVFVRDMVLGRNVRVSVSTAGVQGNADSSAIDIPAISLSGRAVAFYSAASNLVTEDTNGVNDAFVRR
jgi:Tol biopolymer transport system component